MSNISSNKTITKNVIALFFRTIITIFFSLYTSRLLLIKLGESDFGIFSVVGGIAVMFSFISNSLFDATQRYLALSLSNSSSNSYKQIFTTSLNCYFAISILITILAESVGLYIVNHWLSIPQDRLIATNYVYQFAILTFVLGLTNAPFRASIIAHEKFKYFAYSDIITKILKLLIVYIISISPFDKLIIYSALFMGVSLIQLTMDKVYCQIKFKQCRYIRYWNIHLFKSLLTFSSFTLIRTTADMGVSQSNNIITNVFGGTIASASYGIANQVWATLNGFFLNVQSAFNPQIIKSWGDENRDRFETLILNSSKFSSFVVIFMSIPLIVNMPLLLKVWLHNVPPFATAFCRASIISCYISSMVNPVYHGIIATGHIKKYQIISSLILAFAIPVSFISLKLGAILVCIYIVKIVFQLIELCYCGYYLKKETSFNVRVFLLNCIKNTLILCLCLILTFIIGYQIKNEIVATVISSFSGCMIFLVIVWFFGLTSPQRGKICRFITKFIKKNQ